MAGAGYDASFRISKLNGHWLRRATAWHWKKIDCFAYAKCIPHFINIIINNNLQIFTCIYEYCMHANTFIQFADQWIEKSIVKANRGFLLLSSAIYFLLWCCIPLRSFFFILSLWDLAREDWREQNKCQDVAMVILHKLNRIYNSTAISMTQSIFDSNNETKNKSELKCGKMNAESLYSLSYELPTASEIHSQMIHRFRLHIFSVASSISRIS